jgi:dihydropteroate synthase
MTARLELGRRTLVMGVVNVTPDSFSGDGLATPGRDEAQIVAAARDQARRFVDDGADIIDVGAESTRPAAFYGEHPEADEATELRLAIPVVEAIVADLGERAVVSIDTTKGAVARAALAAGAGMVNDVWAGRRDPATVEAAAEAGSHLVLMHNKQVAEYPDGLMNEILSWLSDAVESAVAAGVPRSRLLIDPGIGFGKTPAHSIEVMRRLSGLRRLGQPILVGTSRKRFIGEILGGAPVEDRLEGTLASVVLAIGAGADVVRVHDVRPVVRAVRVADAILRGRQQEASREAPQPDRIALLGMRFAGRHGALPGEQDRPQPFEVDVVIERELGTAAATDDLADSVDYATVFERVRTVLEGPSRRLLETLAVAIADGLLADYAIDAVEVRLRKPRSPLAGELRTVEIAVRRTRRTLG